MKDGFLQALRRTAETGEPPIPEPCAAREQPMGELHEQLLASLQERGEATAASPVHVPTASGDGGVSASTSRAQEAARRLTGVAAGREAAARFQRDRYEGAKFPEDLRDRPRASRGAARKGTIEEALGEVPAAQEADHGRDATGGAPTVSQGRAAAPDPRASDDEGPVAGVSLHPARAAGVAGGDHRRVDHRSDPHLGEVRAPVGTPGHTDPRTETCTTCKGRGFLTYGRVTTHCEACGGEGKVRPKLTLVPDQYRVPEQVTASKIDELDRIEAAEDAVEQALQAEAAGVQPLPLDTPMTVHHEVLGPEIVESFLDEPEVGHVNPAEGAQGEGDSQPPGTPASLSYDLPIEVDLLPPFCFICGPAGTGKTFWAKALAAGDREGVILAATTGIAAVNLGEGTTINALLKFYDTNSLMEAFTGGWLEAQLKKLRQAGLRRIVLDEVSMLDGDQLTILSRAIDNVNQDRQADDAEMGLILVGDFAQLPPVRAPFAFESAEWARYAEATYGLTTIRRQADQEFVSALQAVRRGDHRTALEFFAPRLEQMTHPTFQGTTILAKNDAVDKYNQLRLDKVTGNGIEFPSARWGKLRAEWGGPPKPPYEWGVPERLKLKIGALVMILANRNVAEMGDPPEYLYVNGDLGEIVDATASTCTVVLQRTGEPVEVKMITRENTIPLEPGRRKALREEGHPERITPNGKSEVIGACSYMPLRLAYASTVHKSQGLSLDQVQVNIRDHFFATPGMLYVALSRARTAEGLRLVGTVEGFRARCNVSQKVLPWL